MVLLIFPKCRTIKLNLGFTENKQVVKRINQIKGVSSVLYFSEPWLMETIMLTKRHKWHFWTHENSISFEIDHKIYRTENIHNSNIDFSVQNCKAIAKLTKSLTFQTKIYAKSKASEPIWWLTKLGQRESFRNDKLIFLWLSRIPWNLVWRSGHESR